MSLTGYVTPLGIKVNEKKLMDRLGGRKKLNTLLNNLTVKEKQQPGRPRAYGKRKGYKRIDHNLYFPKNKISQLIKTKIVVGIKESTQYEKVKTVTLPEEKWEIVRPFYDYQVVAAEYIVEEVLSKQHAAYVQMETGLGKTCFSIAAGSLIGGPILVIAPTDKIRKDWIIEFQTVFPNLIVNSYKNLPKKLPKKTKKVEYTAENSDVVVGVINTICKKKPGFFEKYRLVIIDEAHESHSPTKMELMWLLQEVDNVIMLSATPDDSTHGLDKIVYHFGGNPIYAETDIPGFDVSGVCFKGRIREINYYGDPDCCEIALSEAGTVNTMGTINNLLEDEKRLELIVAETVRMYNLHNNLSPEKLLEMGLGARPADVSSDKFPEDEIRTHSIFIFVEMRKFLPLLQAELLKKFSEEDIDVPELDESVILRGGATDEQCHNAKHSRIVLTTYGYSRRGVSLTNMSCIIYGTPRRNGQRQLMGRFIRRGSDQSIVRQLIDIKDMRSPLKNQSTTRRKAYKLKNYPIYMAEHHYDGDLEDIPNIGDEKLIWQSS
jgi:hypothetical protein